MIAASGLCQRGACYPLRARGMLRAKDDMIGESA